MNFRDIYIKGMLAQAEDKATSDAKREKSYRGGNAGIVMGKDLPANSCARKAIARSEGRYEEIDWQTNLMFDIGQLNEDRWHDKIRAAGFTVESADDLVRLETEGGTPVTGSPDSIVATDKDGGRFLIEHKHLSSFWTYRSVVIEGKPKLENMAQAGLYSMGVGEDVPFCLLYTASVKFSGPAFLTKLVPKPTDPGSENFNYTYYKYNGKTRTYKGKKIKEKSKLVVPGHLKGMYPKDLYHTLGADLAEFKDTQPTVVQFDLRWNAAGGLEYSHMGKWNKTVISKENIMAFYNLLEKAEKDEVLPKRPIQIDASGEPLGFNPCDYCSLSNVCDKYENDDYSVWLREAKKITY